MKSTKVCVGIGNGNIVSRLGTDSPTGASNNRQAPPAQNTKPFYKCSHKRESLLMKAFDFLSMDTYFYCDHCEGDLRIRNPTGKCDHLKYPENCSVCKNLMDAKHNPIKEPLSPLARLKELQSNGKSYICDEAWFESKGILDSLSWFRWRLKKLREDVLKYSKHVERQSESDGKFHGQLIVDAKLDVIDELLRELEDKKHNEV